MTVRGDEQRHLLRALPIDERLPAAEALEIRCPVGETARFPDPSAGRLRRDDLGRPRWTHRLHQHMRNRRPRQDHHPDRGKGQRPSGSTRASAPARREAASSVSSRQRVPSQYMSSMIAPNRTQPKTM